MHSYITQKSSSAVLRRTTFMGTQNIGMMRAFSLKSRENNEGITFSRGFIDLGFVVFVREKYACLVHRFQKYNRQMNPGLNFKIPIIDTLEYTHDLREQVVEISTQVAVTKDNVALHIDGVLYIQIVDPKSASYNVENIYQAITNLAQTTMRSEIGKLTLDKTFEERDTLNHNIIKAIDKETKDWGVLALRYEIKDIEPPSNIQKSMILQAEAERRKRASILTSEGDRTANINVAEAEKRAAILTAEGAAESMIIQADASSQSINMIDKALKSEGGIEAAQFLLGQRYIKAYQQVAKKENTIIIPSEPVNVSGQIQDSLNFFKKNRGVTTIYEQESTK